MVGVDYGARTKSSEAVLFPFDRASLPFRHGLELSLEEAGKHPDNPVIPLGAPGTPDCVTTAYYGSVIRIDGEYRMWYLGGGDLDPGRPRSWYRTPKLRVCYATSADGLNWVKPQLGLVEYNGSKRNNLVDLDCDGKILACVVLYEPDDPAPERRFKMSYEIVPGAMCFVACSPDGLRWKPSPANPVVKHSKFEQSGLIRWNGCYYVLGQGGGFKKRVLYSYASYDFDTWTEAMAIGFRREALGPLQSPLYGGRTGEQVHLGAALWDRGNVILGFYGQWHGPSPVTNDRRYLALDIGLLVSHDAMHYEEPIPDFKIIPATEEDWPALQPGPRLTQGQGFENIGEQSCAWYGTWGPGGGDGIRLATWPRDRLGCFSVNRRPIEGQGPSDGLLPHFISCPLQPSGEGAQVFVNADGLSKHCLLRVAILDERFRPVSGFSGDACGSVEQSGFRQAVTWQGKKALPRFSQPVRIQVSYDGLRPEDARVYAVYVAGDPTE